MKVTLSLETTVSKDTSIMVDALRASTTITLALNSFEKVIPCFSPEEAFELKEEFGGVIAGERGGAKLEGFDIGNSPTEVESYESNEKTLILTTSNGTRILKSMDSKVLVGSLVNAKAVGKKASEIAEEHIDVVMAGVRGEFAVEDFLASGEILYWISQSMEECELSEMAKAAILASRNYNSVKKEFYNSHSGKRLSKLGYKKDINLCCQKNISENVAKYENNELTLYM